MVTWLLDTCDGCAARSGDVASSSAVIRARRLVGDADSLLLLPFLRGDRARGLMICCITARCACCVVRAARMCRYSVTSSHASSSDVSMSVRDDVTRRREVRRCRSCAVPVLCWGAMPFVCDVAVAVLAVAGTFVVVAADVTGVVVVADVAGACCAAAAVVDVGVTTAASHRNPRLVTAFSSSLSSLLVSTAHLRRRRAVGTCDVRVASLSCSGGVMRVRASVMRADGPMLRDGRISRSYRVLRGGDVSITRAVVRGGDVCRIGNAMRGGDDARGAAGERLRLVGDVGDVY